MKNRIKEIREKKNISQSDIANELNITRQAISQYENGHREPKLATWQKLADYFGVSVPYLQGITDVKSDPNDLFKNQQKVRRKQLSNLEQYVEDRKKPISIIARLRKENGITQKQLADYLGVSKQQLDLYEKGEKSPTFEEEDKLERYFNLNSSYLMGYVATDKEIEDKTVAILNKGYKEDQKTNYGYIRYLVNEYLCLANIHKKIEHYNSKQRTNFFKKYFKFLFSNQLIIQSVNLYITSKGETEQDVLNAIALVIGNYDYNNFSTDYYKSIVKEVESDDRNRLEMRRKLFFVNDKEEARQIVDNYIKKLRDLINPK